jgi:hypothetical protein
VSETFAWNIAAEWDEIAKPICAYYLGEHDPSGLQIEENLESKLRNFSDNDFLWERIAVTDDQFDRPDLLGFPVKPTVQHKIRNRYTSDYGNRCVEIDALPASEVRELVRDTIERHINEREWLKLQETERLERESIRSLRLAPILNGNGARKAAR